MCLKTGSCHFYSVFNVYTIHLILPGLTSTQFFFSIQICSLAGDTVGLTSPRTKKEQLISFDFTNLLTCKRC